MAYVSRRSLILNQLYSQATVVALSIINTYYPEYLNYTFIVFIAIFFIMMLWRSRLKFRASSNQLREIKESKKIYEEKISDVTRVMSLDTQLVQEMKPLTRFLLITMMTLAFTMVWYFLYFSFASSLTKDLSIPAAQRFATFLVGYEIPIILMAIVTLNQTRLLKNFPQIPKYYTLFEKGLIGENIVMMFPLREHEVKLDAKRGFVELINKNGRNGTRIRLYGSRPKELFELIKNYAFKE